MKNHFAEWSLSIEKTFWGFIRKIYNAHEERILHDKLLLQEIRQILSDERLTIFLRNVKYGEIYDIEIYSKFSSLCVYLLRQDKRFLDEDLNEHLQDLLASIEDLLSYYLIHARNHGTWQRLEQPEFANDPQAAFEHVLNMNEKLVKNVVLSFDKYRSALNKKLSV